MNDKQRMLYWNHIMSLSNSHTLRTVFTHYTYFGTDKNKGNSAYIYAGKYIFRGILAKRMLKKVIRPVVHVEQALTKCYSKKELSKLFDLYQLNQHVKAGETLDINSRKSDFVLALLGFIVLSADVEFINQFIDSNFIEDASRFFPKEAPRIEEIVNNYYLENEGLPVSENTIKLEVGYETTLSIGNKPLVCVTSASYKYSKKKAYKTLFRLIQPEHIEY